jgi:hypothetical protein
MTDRKIIHLIRTGSGEVMATARPLSPEAVYSYRANNCEIFAFEIELPVFVAADTVGTAKRIDG